MIFADVFVYQSLQEYGFRGGKMIGTGSMANIKSGPSGGGGGGNRYDNIV